MDRNVEPITHAELERRAKDRNLLLVTALFVLTLSLPGCEFFTVTSKSVSPNPEAASWGSGVTKMDPRNNPCTEIVTDVILENSPSGAIDAAGRCVNPPTRVPPPIPPISTPVGVCGLHPEPTLVMKDANKSLAAQRDANWKRFQECQKKSQKGSQAVPAPKKP